MDKFSKVLLATDNTYTVPEGPGLWTMLRCVNWPGFDIDIDLFMRFY